MDFNDILLRRSRLTQLDLAVALVPAIGTWLGALLAVDRLGAQYRELGIAPEGLGGMLFASPSLLLAWPVVVAFAWLALRGNAANRGKLRALAYGGSAVIFGACYFLWNAPIVGSTIDALR